MIYIIEENRELSRIHPSVSISIFQLNFHVQAIDFQKDHFNLIIKEFEQKQM